MKFLSTEDLSQLLQSTYPDKEWTRSPFIEDGAEHEVITFLHDSIAIYDPFKDDVGNDRPDLYGLSEEHARLLRRHNREYEKHQFGSEYDLNFVFEKVKEAVTKQSEKSAEFFLDDYGFTPFHTGGGCMAYAIHNPDGSHILVTDADTGLPKTMARRGLDCMIAMAMKCKAIFQNNNELHRRMNGGKLCRVGNHT